MTSESWDEYDPDDFGPGGRAAFPRSRADRATFDAADEAVVAGNGGGARAAAEWGVLLISALVIAAVLRLFLLQAFYIPSESMVPTLEIGDRVLVNKVATRTGVGRGDVVVFKNPPELEDSDTNDVIKRVIALPGDTVKGQGGVLYVNGAPLQEPYLPPGVETVSLPQQVVPEGTLWVMGDNRTESADSRFFGAIDEDLLVGRAFLVFWPPSDFGTL